MKRTGLYRALGLLAVVGVVVSGTVGAAQPSVRAAAPVTITFWNGPDTTGTVPTLIANFNKMMAGKVKVVLQAQAADTGTYFKNLQRALQNGSTTPDVFAGDVIWPAQLAAAGLILPVDKYFSSSMQKQYLAGTIQDVQYKGHIYGAPWFTDFGLVYYRKDLLAKYHLAVPSTWQQLQQEAVMIVKKGGAKEGLVFQGDQYEGLVCDALEYVHSNGAAIYGPRAASTSAAAASALGFMRSMITSGASPNAVSTYKEQDTVNDFTNGNAVFARNWPYMWSIVQQTKAVANKVGVMAIPPFAGQKTGYGTIGGWWLGINKNSRNADAAWQFINYLIGSQQQQYFAIHGGHAVALKAANSAPAVKQALPWLGPVSERLSVLPRPTSPVYNDISLEMQKDFHGVLDGSMSPQAAVSAIEAFVTTAEARFH